MNINNPTNQERIKCSIDFTSPTMSDYLIKLTNRDNSIIAQEHDVTNQTNAQTDYRYIGADPNNYVCLKGDGDCTDDELYRIIGVIPTQKDDSGEYENRVKLVKYISYGEHYWSGSKSNSSNNWKESTLNTETLNTEYWSKISDYHQYIETAKWYLGGGSWDGLVNEYYKNERGGSYIVNNIGLLYTSDYGYATSGNEEKSRDNCLGHTLRLWHDEFSPCNQSNYLYNSNEEKWLINQSGTNAAYLISYEMKLSQQTTIGGINAMNVNLHPLYVYPTFYLKTNVQYASGNGSKNNPYRIMINE